MAQAIPQPSNHEAISEMYLPMVPVTAGYAGLILYQDIDSVSKGYASFVAPDDWGSVVAAYLVGFTRQVTATPVNYTATRTSHKIGQVYNANTSTLLFTKSLATGTFELLQKWDLTPLFTGIDAGERGSISIVGDSISSFAATHAFVRYLRK